MTNYAKLPVKLEVPIPSYESRARGIYAKGRFGANTKVRLNQLDKQTIEQAAHMLGLPIAAFMRQVSVHAATTLLEATRDDNDNDQHK